MPFPSSDAQVEFRATDPFRSESMRRALIVCLLGTSKHGWSIRAPMEGAEVR